MNENFEEELTSFTDTEILKEEQKSLSMRIVSKYPSIRKEAYEEILSTNQTEKYIDHFTMFLSDSSPNSLHSALQVVLSSIQHNPTTDEQVSSWAKIIIEKTLGCSHVQCQDISKEIICELFSMHYEVMMSTITTVLSSSNSKNTKKIMQYENILEHLISEFGTNLCFGEVDGIIKRLTSASNPGIRNIANKIMKEIYAWDKENEIANEVLKVKEKEMINCGRKELVMPNRKIVPVKRYYYKDEQFNEDKVKYEDNDNDKCEDDDKDKDNNEIQMEKESKHEEVIEVEKKNEIIDDNSNNTGDISSVISSGNVAIPTSKVEINDNQSVSMKSIAGDYYFSNDFIDKLSAKHQKANEKKKLLEELSQFLNQSPQYITNKTNIHFFNNLFDILKNFLNENNTNVILAVISLLSHLSKHFLHQDNYAAFLLDIIPKLFDKFNLSNDNINDEVHKLLNEIIDYSLCFKDFFVYLENISTDDNENYTINVLKFTLRHVELDKGLSLSDFSTELIDAFQRLSIDDHDIISSLAFNTLELLNQRCAPVTPPITTPLTIPNESKSQDTPNVTRPIEETKSPVKEEEIIAKPEETKEDYKPKGKTFRSMKRKNEINKFINKEPKDKVKEDNKEQSGQKEDILIEEKPMTLIDYTKQNNKGNNNNNHDDILIKAEVKTKGIAMNLSDDFLQEESAIEPIIQQNTLHTNHSMTNIANNKSASIKNKLNNDEMIVGSKSNFNQMFSNEIDQVNEAHMPFQIQKSLTKNPTTPHMISLPNKDIKKQSKACCSISSDQLPFVNHSQEDDDDTNGYEFQQKLHNEQPLPSVSQEHTLVDFQRKIDLALQQEDNNNLSADANDPPRNNPTKKTNTKDESEFEEIKSIFGQDIITNIDSSKWEMKKKAFEDMSEYIQSNTLPSNKANVLFSYLKYKLKDFKESNFNINREAITLFNNLFSAKSITFDSRHHLAILNAYYDKLCDSKLKDQTNQLITTLLEVIGVNLLMTTILNKLQKKPNINLLKEYAGFFAKCIEDFDISQLPLKELVELCKTMAANSNPQVRTASITLLCALYKYIGNDIRILIKDIKESTLKLIESEFDKIAVIAKDSNDHKKKKIRGGSNEEIGNKEGMIMINRSSELLPRVDISRKITPKMIKDIQDGKWPEKKEACEAIERILADSNMKILPNGLGDLFNLIKNKLSDGNKNIVRMIIGLLSKLIEAIALGFKPYTKQIALALIPNFADKTQVLREECHICFEKWVIFTGFDTFVYYVPNFIKTENYDIRIELMKLLMKNKALFNKTMGEQVFREMITPLLLCLQDKALAVRLAAEEMILFSLQFISLNNYYANLTNFKPAIENALKLILDKLRNEDSNYPSQVLPMNNQETSSSSCNISAITPAENNNNKKNLSASKPEIHSPISEEKTIQSIRVYKKTKQNMSNEDIRPPMKKDLSTTPTHSNNSSSSLTNILKSPNSSKTTSNTLHSKKLSMIKFQVFQSNNIYLKPNKEKRFEFDRKYKFSVDSLSTESEHKLRDQVRSLFTEEFMKKFFTNDFKNVVDAVNSLNIAMQRDENQSCLIENLDLILKIIGFKFITNHNPSMLKVLFEFFDVLYTRLANVVQLNETEITIIVSILVDKLSVTNSVLKEHLQSLVDNFFLLLTPSKAMVTALNCSLGKNNKIKAEILDICTDMYIENSIDIVNRQYARILSRFIWANDNNVKAKTIPLFKEIYSKIGDELWGIIDINEKEREFLEANLYEYQSEEEEEGEYEEGEGDDQEQDQEGREGSERCNDHRNSFNSSDVEVNDKDKEGNEDDRNKNQSHMMMTNNNRSTCYNHGHPLQMAPITNFATNFQTNINHYNNTIKSTNTTLDNNNSSTNTNTSLPSNNLNDQDQLFTILKNLMSSDIQTQINAIIIIHECICAKYEDNKVILLQNIDIIITTFVDAMNILFHNQKLENILIKFAKYLATVLCKIATNKDLISNITYDILFKLTEEILQNYLIENLDKIGDNQEGSIIFKSLNSTMLRLLENCNSSHVIIVLLELVRKYRGDPKLSNLAIQCLFKMNETLQTIINKVEIDKILLQFHILLCEMDKGESDRQSPIDQMIVRYIKNFINDIAKSKKEEVLNDYMIGVKQHPMTDKYILKWIHNILSSMTGYPYMTNPEGSKEINGSSKTMAMTNANGNANANTTRQSSGNVITVKTTTLGNTSNNAMTNANEGISSIKKEEGIIKDLKSRMMKQKSLTKNSMNTNPNDINTTITELKKKWNEKKKETTKRK